MGELIDFESGKNRLMRKYRKYHLNELKYKNSLMVLGLYLKKEQIKLIDDETSMFIDFLLERLNDSNNFSNGKTSMAINLRNITKIKYEDTGDIDVLLWIDEYRNISLGSLKNYFGETFKLFFTENVNEFFDERTDSDYSTIEYLFTIVGPINEARELSRLRFNKNKIKLYGK